MPHCWAPKPEATSVRFFSPSPFFYSLHIFFFSHNEIGKRPEISQNWDDQFTEIMAHCWAPKPEARPTVREARMKLESIAPSVERMSSYSISSSSGYPPPSPLSLPLPSPFFCVSRSEVERDEIRSDRSFDRTHEQRFNKFF